MNSQVKDLLSQENWKKISRHRESASFCIEALAKEFNIKVKKRAFRFFGSKFIKAYLALNQNNHSILCIDRHINKDKRKFMTAHLLSYAILYPDETFGSDIDIGQPETVKDKVSIFLIGEEDPTRFSKRQNKEARILTSYLLASKH